jgi:drug/metabolite transporter (DMT)-like permease
VSFLGERLDMLQIAGAGLVLVGVLLSQTATPPESRQVLLEEV